MTRPLPRLWDNTRSLQLAAQLRDLRISITGEGIRNHGTVRWAGLHNVNIQSLNKSTKMAVW